MTLEQLCCVCIGITIQAATFALGILVGASLRRKESVACHRSEENGSLRPRRH
jgi:hypothetical protein